MVSVLKKVALRCKDGVLLRDLTPALEFASVAVRKITPASSVDLADALANALKVFTLPLIKEKTSDGNLIGLYDMDILRTFATLLAAPAHPNVTAGICTAITAFVECDSLSALPKDERARDTLERQEASVSSQVAGLSVDRFYVSCSAFSLVSRAHFHDLS